MSFNQFLPPSVDEWIYYFSFRHGYCLRSGVPSQHFRGWQIRTFLIPHYGDSEDAPELFPAPSEPERISKQQ
jgi:hypothetical protein